MTESIAQLMATFQGSWALKDWCVTKPDGSLSRPFGDQPTGRLIYQRQQMVACLIPQMPARAERTDKHPPVTGLSYFGTWSVQPEQGTVTHHVQGSSMPDWIDTDLVRAFRLDATQLILTATRPSGSVHQLIWQRLATE